MKVSSDSSNGGVIKRADRLLGIRFWALHLSGKVPAYEVFRYYGHQESTGLHFFERVRGTSGRALIGFSEKDLTGTSFKPFCIDDAEVRAATDMKE